MIRLHGLAFYCPFDPFTWSWLVLADTIAPNRRNRPYLADESEEDDAPRPGDETEAVKCITTKHEREDGIDLYERTRMKSVRGAASIAGRPIGKSKAAV